MSEGGLAVAAAEMCIAGRRGMELTLPQGQALRNLFGQTNGTLLVEVQPAASVEFEKIMHGLPFLRVGTVREDQELLILRRNPPMIRLSVEKLLAAWSKSIRKGTL